MANAFIPYGAYWSTPFAKWQGSIAHLNSVRLAANCARRMLDERKLDTSAIDYGVLGITNPQLGVFYGLPWLTGMIGIDRVPGPTVQQACATSARSLQMAAAEAARLGVPQRKPSTQEIQERCLYAMINEGARILDEGIALRASDIDIVYTSGYGFPRYRGGPMFYADTVGLKVILDKILEFRETLDPQYWAPSPLLERLAREGKTFAQWQAEQGR